MRERVKKKGGGARKREEGGGEMQGGAHMLAVNVLVGRESRVTSSLQVRA